MDNQQLSTVLAALRYYQAQGLGDPRMRPNDIHDIATNGDLETSLDSAGIDELCERLNVGDLRAMDYQTRGLALVTITIDREQVHRLATMSYADLADDELSELHGIVKDLRYADLKGGAE